MLIEMCTIEHAPQVICARESKKKQERAPKTFYTRGDNQMFELAFGYVEFVNHFQNRQNTSICFLFFARTSSNR